MTVIYDKWRVKKIEASNARMQGFMRGFQGVYEQAKRNPSVSGSQPMQARLMASAGSDSHRKHKLSGPSVKFGWKATRGGQSHADERRDYWNPAKE